jgi:hypothetical protein
MYSKAALGAFLGVLLVVVPVLQGAADDPPPGSGKRSTVPVLYKPPRVGIPGGRLGGGTRAEGPCPTVKVAVLAPDHVGLTTQDQPILYWYLATTTTAPIEFTVNEPQALRTLLKTQLPVPIQPGIQRVRLADYVIRLMPGRQYEWFVAVLCDAQEPSNNPHMGGIIEYIARPAALQAQLTHADQTQVLQDLI